MLTHFSHQPRYRPLILEIDTTKPGSAADTFVLPLNPALYYCFVVEWGDGTVEKITASSNVTHIYPASGIYRIKLHGRGYGRSMPQLYFNNAGDRQKLLKVLDFGDVLLTTLVNMLYGCVNLTDIDLGKSNFRNIANGGNFLAGCSNFNGILQSLDTSQITNWSGFFFQCVNFNQPVSSLRLDSAIVLNSMHLQCTIFNQPVENYVTDNVTSATNMFNGCSAFNQSVAHFATGKLTNATGMFFNATAFKQDLSGWNITALTNATNMLNGTNINDTGTTTRYDALLNSWAGQSIKPNVPFHGGNAKYSAAASAARDTLVAAGWTITDGGLQT